MGDPGLPIMAGALAVPVSVLLLVLVFALMGRRWVLTGPDAAFEDDDAMYEDDDDLDPAPYRPALEPPPAASPATYDAYRPAPAYGSAPAAQGSHGPGSYAPPAREPYERPAPAPYAPPRPAEVSDWEPYVPAPRRPPEPSSRSSYGTPADPYGAAPREPYAPPSRDPYGAGGRSARTSPATHRGAPNPAGTDRPEPPAQPDPWRLTPEDRRRYSYGPYDAR